MKHFSEDAINNDIYPWGVYVYFPALILGGVLAELGAVQPKLIIVAASSIRIGTRALLLFGTQAWHMQVMEACYATGSMGEVLFLAYTYTVVPQKQYPLVTAAVQTTRVATQALSGLVGDAALHYGHADLKQLMWWSSLGTLLGTLWALALFPVPPGQGRTIVRGQAWCAEKAAVMWRKFQSVWQHRGTPMNPARGIHCSLGAATLWWALSWDPMYWNSVDYESSLYDVLAPAKANDWNGSVYAALLLVIACSSAAYGWPLLQRWADAGPYRTAIGGSIIAAAALAVTGVAAWRGWGLVATFLLFGAWGAVYGIVNAWFNATAASALQNAAAATAAPSDGFNVLGGKASHDATLSLLQGHPGGTTPPMFGFFAAASCISTGVQAVSQAVLFQASAMPIPLGYVAFAAWQALGALALGCVMCYQWRASSRRASMAMVPVLGDPE